MAEARRPGRVAIGLSVLLALALAGCGSSGPPQPLNDEGMPIGHYKLGQPYKINGRWYHPAYDPSYAEVGEASWYGEDFHGLATANGEVFDRDLPTAAHPTLPLPSLVRVTNLENGRTIVVRVNDRGPFAKGRLIDLSQEAARQLDFEEAGTAPVEVQFLALADDATGTPPTPTLVAKRAPAPAGARTVLASAEPSAAVGGGLPACRAVAGDIQVAAFAEPWRARRVVDELARQSLPAPRAEMVHAQGRDVTRVKLGPVGSEREAAAVLGHLQQMGYASAFVMPSTATATQCS
ncbi:septal ring lytic transglycosylase RlpA family protein [Marinivivus vitaminiproducens]|uniref:septal ring lytic transglycosylase RlpA family protein n=1 Tax=Marinivivus vitaminiproducens TaxID=3035935 RepID=UPI0027A8C3A5|nr:septal ring lytic transglycosylase RlpA family protein [Geminicoccaceae bacterium SCSIO 64248]